MLFNSLHFLIFFPIVVALYFALPYRFRWMLLLTSSAYFYMSWNPAYILLVAVPLLIDYVVAMQMDASQDARRRKLLLTLSITSNLALLCLFKYFSFFNGTLSRLLAGVGVAYHPPVLDLLLPVGISFYTFQSMGYAIDVYRRNIPAEKHLGRFSLFVLFFPQLVAGPIERAGHMLPQYLERHDFDYDRVTRGCFLILLGLFKKMVIADRLAGFVEVVYRHPQDYGGLALVIGTVCFAFQIYYDFSAYSEIAIGAANVLGYRLMDNFRQPYLAKSSAEFWKRWHISLSTWFRDYLYIPLGGNRASDRRSEYNLLVTFVISGLWHGASWTFVIWGALNGFYLLFGRWTAGIRQRCAASLGITRFPVVHKALQALITFSLICLAWIFFRASSLEDALYIVTHLFSNVPNVLAHLGDPAVRNSQIFLMHSLYECAFLAAMILGVEGFHYAARFSTVAHVMARMPQAIRWTAYVVLALLIMNAGKTKLIPFIYFQF